MIFTDEQKEKLMKLFEQHDTKIRFDTLPTTDEMEGCYLRHKNENRRHSRIIFSISGYFGITIKCGMYTVKEARQAMNELAEDISFAKKANDIIGYRECD